VATGISEEPLALEFREIKEADSSIMLVKTKFGRQVW
jgi:hypothetical protein